MLWAIAVVEEYHHYQPRTLVLREIIISIHRPMSNEGVIQQWASDVMYCIQCLVGVES